MNDLSTLMANYKAWLRETKNREELYKWEATKHFQENWNIDAPDFYTMLKQANTKSGNLLYMLSKAHVIYRRKTFP